MNAETPKVESPENERGNAMIEMAICLPFILIILMASVDLGRALNEYLTITRVVYEATRFGASVSQLEAGAFESNSTAPAGHQAIRNRVALLLDRYGIPQEQVTRLRTELVNTGTQLEVKVEIDWAFDAIFAQFDFMDALGSAEATGPYLYLGSA
ncbi:MAG: pilus assembly protein [Bdellovibrionales bacterium]|nr:pilus assembly protein [Bdellovibrionales bacterium]